MSENLNIYKVVLKKSYKLPVLNITLLKGKKTIKLTGKTVGFEVGDIPPFFLYNVKLRSVFDQKWIPKVSDEVLLSAITILNKGWKKEGILTDVESIEKFKKYAEKTSFFGNELFEYYVTHLKKLVFFQEKLFEEVLLLSDEIVHTDDSDLIFMNSIVKENINFLREILFEKLVIKDEKVEYIYDGKERINFYQPSFAFSHIMEEKLDGYTKNFDNSLRSFELKPIQGDFFVIVKFENDKKIESFFGSFNVYLQCNFTSETVSSISTNLKRSCENREKKIREIFGKLTGLESNEKPKKGGMRGMRFKSRKRQRRRQSKRPNRFKRSKLKTRRTRVTRRLHI